MKKMDTGPQKCGLIEKKMKEDRERCHQYPRKRKKKMKENERTNKRTKGRKNYVNILVGVPGRSLVLCRLPCSTKHNRPIITVPHIVPVPKRHVELFDPLDPLPIEVSHVHQPLRILGEAFGEGLFETRGKIALWHAHAYNQSMRDRSFGVILPILVAPQEGSRCNLNALVKDTELLQRGV
jgi:hypothetical protein